MDAALQENWRSEADVEDALAAFLEASGFFRVFRQVMGRSLVSICGTGGRVRADILLLATRQAIDAGWREGPILFEVKWGGKPIGPAVSQMLDYLDCAWMLPNGVEVLAGFGFLFPVPKQYGPLASVRAQNRVGTATLEAGELNCYCGEQRVLTVWEAGAMRVANLGIGRKFGSRS